jgi:SAM-dependent methyltransferase
MIRLLKKFVSLNVRLSEFVERRYHCFVEEEGYTERLLHIVNNIVGERMFCSVLEVGGINRPLLQRSDKIRYDGLDIEYKQQCDNIYDNFFVQSVENPINFKYDLIVSRTLLEHVPDNDASVAQMYEALKYEGYVAHYLPSKYHPYSVILRLIGPKWQVRLIKTLRPWAADVTGYQAFFDKCSPKEMKKLFASKGFRNIKVVPFFRANDYFKFFFPCYIVITLWENICNRLKFEQLCSGFIIVAQK